MTTRLYSLYQNASDSWPNWFPYTSDWKRMSKEYLAQEELFLSKLIPELRAHWEKLQCAAFSLDDLEQQGYFYYALALGMELERLSAKG